MVVLNAAELVKFPQGPAAWTVKVESTRLLEDGTLKKTGAPVIGLARVEVAQDEIKRRYTLSFTSGPAREVWELYRATSRVSVAEQPDGRVVAAAGPRLFGVLFDPGAFDWMAGAVRRDGPAPAWAPKNSVCYTGRREVRDFNNELLKTLPCAVWIDADTKLPLALDDGENFVTYDFKAERPAELRMPAKLKTKLTRLLLRAGFDLVDDL